MDETGHGDVISVLTHDHREVEEMFADLEKAGIGDARNRRDLVDQVVIALVRHSVAEEQHLYPAVREHVPDGANLADREIREHTQLEYVMKSLDAMDPSDAGFEPGVSELMTIVRAHVAEEEQMLFPKLAAVCSPEQLIDLGTKVTAAKNRAPTHPRPGAPDKPPANKVLSTGLGLVDRVRDALTHRGTDE